MTSCDKLVILGFGHGLYVEFTLDLSDILEPSGLGALALVVKILVGLGWDSSCFKYFH